MQTPSEKERDVGHHPVSGVSLGSLGDSWVTAGMGRLLIPLGFRLYFTGFSWAFSRVNVGVIARTVSVVLKGSPFLGVIRFA